jgi:choline dehydrogenase-like flavoprotein
VKLGEASEFSEALPSEGNFGNNAMCVGGGTVSYGAMSWRFMPQDFRMKTTYGVPEGSTLDDWPVSYAEMAPYYEKAEWDIGVSGDAGANPFEGPRTKGYPMGALPPNNEAEILRPAAEKLGWHPFPIPMAINSEPYQGRSACIYCPHCVGFQCEVDAKNSSTVTNIPRALKTGNCELRTGAVVTEVMTNAQGKATGVSYVRKGQRYTQPARVVIVAAAAIETARLLLNSKSRLFPRGLGNNGDWVGRNLQGHGYCGAHGVFEQEVYDGLGPGARIAVCDFNHGNEGVIGGGLLANEFIRLPYLFSIRVRPSRVPRWGQAHKDFVRRYYKRSMAVQGPIQEVPRWENRIEVDPSRRDAYGIPVVKMTGKRHANDFVVGRLLASRAAEWLRAAGATEVWQTSIGGGVNGHQHQAGTCRMGKDPKTSAVDPSCRLHEVDNVYVADGSVHVTNGGFNPALTIQANAYRVAERIAKEQGRG